MCCCIYGGNIWHHSKTESRKKKALRKSGAKVRDLFLVYRAFPQLRIWSAAKMGPHSTSIRDTSWHHDEVQRLASFLFHSNGNRDVGLFASVCISPWNCLIKDPSSLPSGHCTPQSCTPQYWLSSDSLASVLTTNSPQQGCTGRGRARVKVCGVGRGKGKIHG